MNAFQNYTYVEPAKLLEEGEHDVTLGTPYVTMLNGYTVLRFPFYEEDIGENIAPNHFDLFDAPTGTSPERMMMFCKQASKIKACFLLEGPFTEQNILTWANHRGKIIIKKDKDGFHNVAGFVVNPEAYKMKGRL